MNATVILYILFLLFKLFFSTILYDIDPTDLPKLDLNINPLRGFYYQFPTLLPPPTIHTLALLLLSKLPLHSPSLYKSQKHLAVHQRLMFLFRSVELSPESGCLATALHEPVWLRCDKQLVGTISKLISKNLLHNISASSFFHLMKGGRGSRRELEGHGDCWSHEDCFPNTSLL